MDVHYSTHDITAIGITQLQDDYCRPLPSSARSGCGDYVLNQNILTFYPGEASKSFYIYLTNDDCYEHFTEYVQIQMDIPGGDALLGENHIAMLRIDDDDFGRAACPDTGTVTTHVQGREISGYRMKCVGGETRGDGGGTEFCYYVRDYEGPP